MLVSALFGVLLLLGPGAFGQECSTVSITNEWGGAWQGLLPVTFDHEAHGWDLVLSFDSDFDSFNTWVADAVVNDARTVTLTNLDWNGDEMPGDVLNVEFQVYYSGSSRPLLIGAILDGTQDICDGSSGKTSQSPCSHCKATPGSLRAAAMSIATSFNVTVTPENTTPPDVTVMDSTTPGPIPTTGVPQTTVEPPVSGGDYDYNQVLAKSLLFYEAQRSGPLPSSNRIDWRGDSAMGDYVLGGYYDAGDHVKFGFPMASMMTQLAWGAVTFQSGYDAALQTQFMKECLQWATDYFIAAHPSPTEFYGQIGDGDADHAFWGRPEDMTMARPEFKITASCPGSDLAAETAAALAASSMFYDAIGETAMATDALAHARDLFDFANDHRGVYTSCIPAGSFYNSWSGYNDELVWAAAWMYKATGESGYLTTAESLYTSFSFGDNVPTEFSWDNKQIGATVLLYEATGSSSYESDINDFISYLQGAQYTPKGLIFIDAWGSLRHAGNLAHLCLQIAELGLQQTWCEDFAETQINYALGDGGRSFVVGFGSNPPERPHHRSSSCPDMPEQCDWDEFNSPAANPQTLNGALVGGPDANDQYTDDRGDFQSNEVATDYNAGFQSAVAALAAKYAA